ncbi:TIR domain-containing protein [Variovorax sp. dw_954]|uniref:TIR domain-containing protein n=1 Tax=Variovorax sp. dw_954 TaxID=2720078 RepID=UPI001BD2132D|nr:TIR domain-containing protein [Variovorax sp. dw_954]
MDSPTFLKAPTEASGERGFVVCHHPRDLDWAAFIEGAVHDLGYATQLDEYDVAAGDNFVRARHEALKRLGGALVVTSRSFLADSLADSLDDVWTAALAGGSRVVPVVIDDAALPGLLAARAPIRLHGLDERQCIARLRERLAPRRPDTAPAFPVTAGNALLLTPPNPWRRLLEHTAPRLHAFFTRVGLLAEPPELADLRDYLARLRSGLAQELRERSYVPQEGRDVPSPSAVPLPGGDPFERPVHHLIRQVMGTARGGDGATAQISAVSRRSKVVRDIANSIVHSDEPLVLLGDPGSGKTMTLQHAVLNVIDAQRWRVYPTLPVYIRLGDFHVASARPVDGDVDAHVLKGLDARIAARYEALHRAGRLIIFFDGMDEMSRERYGAHVEALSQFAASRHPQTRSLFSCRINDFSPEFLHRRMVLLPFGRDQVREFLSLYVPAWPLRISGENYSLKTLTDRLWSGGLPVDVRNPFVLWLLRYYILATHEWPASRPGLIAFYCRRVYRRKRADPGSQAVLARLPRPFTELGRLAFVLMDRNQGTSASLVDLRPALPGVDVDALAQVGMRCGLLSGSSGAGSMRLRFAHHRLQEFFAARHIRRSGVDVHWQTAIEAPRWQETLVNYVLMRGRSEPVEQLGSAISGFVAEVERRVVARTPKEDDDLLLDDVETDEASAPVADATSAAAEAPEVPWPDTGPLMTDDEEGFAADRVELLSRLLHQGAGSMAQTQVQTFSRAVTVLVEHGNPSTQVKMLWACENVPDADVGNAMVRLLESRIGWVRNQALMLLASPAASSARIGTDLTAQIGFDLARGELLHRLVGHAKAAAASTAPRRWWHLALGVLCMLVLGLGIAALVPLIYWAAVTWLPPKDGVDPGVNIEAFLTPGRYAAVVGIMALIGFVRKSALLWLYVLGAAAAVPVALGYAPLLWSTSLFPFLGMLVTAPFAIYFAAVLLSVPAFLVHYAILAAFALCTLPLSQLRSGVRNASAIARAHCSYGLGVPAGALALISVIGAVLYGLGWLQAWLGRILLPPVREIWSHLNGPQSLEGRLLLGTAAICALVVLGYFVRRSWRKDPREWYGFLLVVAGAAAAGVLVAAVYGLCALYELVAPTLSALFDPLLQPVMLWLDRVAPGRYVVRALLVVLAVGALLVLAVLLRAALRESLTWVAPWRTPFAPNELTPQAWRAKLETADAVGQDIILQRSSQQALGLDAPAFLELLVELQTTFKEDPALGTYWRMRHELRNVIQQEQQGHIGGI